MHNPTGIYEIRNTVNGKRYVGSAVDFGNRWRIHAQSLVRGDHHSAALQRAWSHYGQSAFQFNKLLVCSKENLLMYEQACMDAFKPEYNCAPKAGSQLGIKYSPEVRARMSAANNRRGNPGHVHTPETRAKISANRAGKGEGPRTAERLAKIGAAHKGRPKSEEHRAKISATLMGHKQSAEQIEKRKQTFRAIGFSEKIARFRAKLTDDQVRAIRLSLIASKRQKALAFMYGVDQSVISTIKTRTTYAWVL